VLSINKSKKYYRIKISAFSVLNVLPCAEPVANGKRIFFARLHDHVEAMRTGISYFAARVVQSATGPWSLPDLNGDELLIPAATTRCSGNVSLRGAPSSPPG
jgi:hypothetical protein